MLWGVWGIPSSSMAYILFFPYAKSRFSHDIAFNIHILQAVPYFLGLIVLESVLLFCQGKPLPRFNDSFTSMANGLLSTLHRYVQNDI